MSPNEAGGDEMVERVVLFWLVWFLCLYCCIEPRLSHMLGKCSTTELTPSSDIYPNISSVRVISG